MGKKFSHQVKQSVEGRLDKAKNETDDAKSAVNTLPQVEGSAPPEYDAEVSPDPGGKPCGRLYDVRDDIEIALLDLGGRPCGGGKPC